MLPLAKEAKYGRIKGVPVSRINTRQSILGIWIELNRLLLATMLALG